MNMELRTKPKNDSDKDFVKLMNNSMLEKTNGECAEAQRQQTCGK